MIDRPALHARIDRALGRSRAAVLAGPRQAGKTTLARQFLPPDSPRFFDLENPLDARRLAEPMSTLAPLQGLVVIDEVQRLPQLFGSLRVLIDRSNQPGQYLLLGSAAPSLLQRVNESLLGRVETIEIAGFDLAEVSARSVESAGSLADVIQGLWLRGGFPRAYLADTDADAAAWCRQAIASHVELDLPQLGVGIATPAILRFWRMLAHVHGGIWSAADPARSMGVSETTVRRYLDVLTQTLMVRQLQPWHANLAKRQVKSPKVYLRDSGLLHALLDITSSEQLLSHPRCGASWEGFALEQVLRVAQADEAYFWATHQGAELDLLLLKGQQRIGVEFKRSDVPHFTRSMQIAADDLQLDRLYVVYPGDKRFTLAPNAQAVPLWALLPPSPSPAMSDT